MDYTSIAAAAGNGGCSKDEALWAVINLSENELAELATSLRQRAFGDKIALCIIMNARCGRCPEDCTYCSQSAHNNSEVEVFGLKNGDEIAAAASKAAESGADNFGVVTSGVTVAGEALEDVCRSIERVTSGSASIPVCASFGRMKIGQLLKLKAAGMRRYHHNLETSERFYSKICTTHEWIERVETVKNALEAGLDVCSGGLFGLGESWEDRADLALTLRELGVDSVPLNFLHSHPGTPLAAQEPLTAGEALRIIALYRLILPRVTIRICGGRPKILGVRMREMFRFGANAFMTGDYLTTAGITPESDRKMIEEEGLIVEQ